MKRGIVTSVRRTDDGNEYVIFDGENYYRVLSKKRIRSKSVKLMGNDLEELRESVLSEVKKRFFQRIKFDVELPKAIAFVEKEMEVLWKELAFLKITGDKPFVYFDPDADGIISLLLISEALKVNYRALTPWNLELGNNLSPDLRAPLYLLLDLGSTQDLHPGVRFLSSLGPVYIVDHHYTPTSPPVHLVNPALRDPSLSSFTTAILTSYIVKPWVKKEEWVRVAAAGDRSNVVEWNKEDRMKALALEMASEVFGYNLSVWKQVLETDLWKSLWGLLEHRFKKIDAMAEKKEIEMGELRILIVRYPYPGFHYPHRGKVASWYQDREGHDVVIVQELPREQIFTVSVRSRLTVLSLLNEVKKSGIGEGWGHPNAVTFKTTDPEALVGFLLGWLEGETGKDKN